MDVIDGENIKSWDSQNNGSTSFRFDHTYARGSYSVTTTYLGDTDNYYNPPKKNGEAFGFQATMSTPPAAFNAEDTIDIRVSVSLTLDTLSFFGGCANACSNTRPTPIQTPVKTERVDSGIKFSDLYGEVSIRRGDDEDDSFEFAELDMVIYVGDVIRVKEESGMTLSMPDMSTFTMNSEGRLNINTSNEKENKLKVLAGTIYANVKQMFRTGTPCHRQPHVDSHPFRH